METITIRPRTEEQLQFLRTLLDNLRWDMGVEYTDRKEAPYDLKALNESVARQKEAGTLRRIDPKNIWEGM